MLSSSKRTIVWLDNDQQELEIEDFVMLEKRIRKDLHVFISTQSLQNHLI